MTDATETPTERLGGCILMIALLPFTAFYHAIVGAFVITTLWRWFAVATLGAPPLSIPVAAGLLLIVAWLRLDLARPADRPFRETLADAGWRVYIVAVLGGLTLFEGWIIHRVWL